jgi:TonB family protein
MNFYCRLLLLITLFSTFSFSSARAQSDTPPQNQDVAVHQAAELKPINTPTAPYPEEALKKNVEGKVTVSFVVNANGHVSDAMALSGPPELFQAAIDSVNQWQFEPPANPPVTTTTEIAYGHPHECPGSISTMALEQYSGPLKGKRGTLLKFEDEPMPPYFEQERLAGVSGDMVLAVTINAQGKVTKTRVVKPLSPRLDKAALKTIRTWRFKVTERRPNPLPDEFQLRITYKAMCQMEL